MCRHEETEPCRDTDSRLIHKEGSAKSVYIYDILKYGHMLREKQYTEDDLPAYSDQNELPSLTPFMLLLCHMLEAYERVGYRMIF